MRNGKRCISKIRELLYSSEVEYIISNIIGVKAEVCDVRPCYIIDYLSVNSMYSIKDNKVNNIKVIVTDYGNIAIIAKHNQHYLNNTIEIVYNEADTIKYCNTEIIK